MHLTVAGVAAGPPQSAVRCTRSAPTPRDTGSARTRLYKDLIIKDTMRSVFVAEAKSGSEVTKVVVQFAHTYGEDGHKLLAETSQAPKSHYCKFEVGMWAVVMEYAQGQEVKDGLTNPAHIASLLLFGRQSRRCIGMH